MVKRKSIKAQERNLRLSEAVLGVQTRKFKSSNAAAIALNLRPDTVRRRVRGIQYTQAEAQLPHQLLSKNQEIILLKWIKQLTSSGYAPSHQVLREVADEVRTNRCRIFQGRGIQSQL
jgi:tryptophanyl-tRNA synthetase